MKFLFDNGEKVSEREGIKKGEGRVTRECEEERVGRKGITGCFCWYSSCTISEFSLSFLLLLLFFLLEGRKERKR